MKELEKTVELDRADVLAACKELWSVISFDVLRARAESKGLGRGPVEARARQIQAAAKAAAAAAKAAAAAAVAREAAAARDGMGSETPRCEGR